MKKILGIALLCLLGFSAYPSDSSAMTGIQRALQAQEDKKQRFKDRLDAGRPPKPDVIEKIMDQADKVIAILSAHL